MSETTEYIVTQLNTAGLTKEAKMLKVGATVLLTAAQALARINKVRRKDEHEADAKTRKTKAEKENEELKKQISGLEEQIVELEKKLAAPVISAVVK